jgi:hypothetical protein
MEPLETISVFDVADDRREFLQYLAYLHEQGLRPTRADWLREVADRLMELGSTNLGPPTNLDRAWTLERRRLLVVLTWPYAHGGLSLKFPDPGDGHGIEPGTTGLFARTYRELWADVRTNMKSLEWLAEWRGGWRVLAEQWGLLGDVVWESARLGLVVTNLGQRLSTDAVDALRSDAHGRAARAREGFVLTWWDIVAVAESIGFSFEPFDTDVDGKKRANGEDGRYLWNRQDLVERISRASYEDRVNRDMLARIEAAGVARTRPEFAPLELHRRITADSRISPPQVGSKYRSLFEHLDAIYFAGRQASVSLSREELDELTARAQFEVPRIVRGARGSPGLPRFALSNVQWWYGPWNPDEADREASWAAVAHSSWADAMGKKSQTRAWMAAGLRAKPIINQGTKTLVAVRFEPVTGREYWWPFRDQLRDGSFSRRIE